MIFLKKNRLQYKQDNRILTIPACRGVAHELQYDCRRLPVSRQREIIESYIEDVIRQNMVILPYDERAAGWHAEERARLAAQGQTPPLCR